MAVIGLVFGGRSVEHRVSVQSARAVGAALEEAGHSVVPLGICEDGCWIAGEPAAAALAGETALLPATGGRVVESLEVLIAARAEVVFPLVHGTWGEDGTLQGLLEMADLPYVGAGVASSAVAMDKVLCKQVLEAAGIPVVPWATVDRRQWTASRRDSLRHLERLPSPRFIKPSVGGSSVGVSRAASEEELRAALETALEFHDTALVEIEVVGRELECSVLGDERLEASAVGEIVPGSEFYDYADKYLTDAAELVAPARLGADLERRVRELAVDAFGAVGGWGMARVDFLLEEPSRLFVNEINTLPGFTRISMYPRLWELSGLPLPRLVDRLVEIAIARHQRRTESALAIGRWLRRLDAAD